MQHRYIRHSTAGFVLWPAGSGLHHLDMAQAVVSRRGGHLRSAGVVNFTPDGLPVCSGGSMSLDLNSMQGDSHALALQLGLVPAPQPAGASA